MNNSMIVFILGQIIRLEGLLMIIPCLTSLIYQEHEIFAFLIVIISCLVIGTLMTLRKPANQTIYLKEGCVATAFSWILLSIFGCMPFVISGEIPSFTNALFETISGFTTTGASILSDVESMSHGMMLWRCFTHWIGGMGVLVFLLAIIPMNSASGSNMNLMKAESPGPSVGKLVPRLKHTARILYVIYFGMTVLEVIFLMFGHMSLFDALCTAFGTAGTGGFGIKNDSFGSFSPYIQWVVTVFMILFGVNFNFYYFVLFRNIRKALSMEEVRTYFLIILTSVAILFVSLMNTMSNISKALAPTERALYGKHAKNMMKTDVRETDDSYEVDMDLPGFKKDEVKVQLADGYLTIEAAKGLDKDEKDKKSGKYIRRERYAGSMSRSFYVGEGVTQEDIHAKYEHGVLKLSIPKKEEQKKVEKSNYIAIE